MNAAKTIYFWMILGLAIVAGSNVHAAVARYTLDNVILDDGNTQMTAFLSGSISLISVPAVSLPGLLALAGLLLASGWYYSAAAPRRRPS